LKHIIDCVAQHARSLPAGNIHGYTRLKDKITIMFCQYKKKQYLFEKLKYITKMSVFVQTRKIKS